MAFTLPQVPFKLTPEDMGAPDLVSALTKGINLGYLPREKQAGLESTLAENIHKNLMNKWYEPNIKSEISSREASTTGTNLENQLKQLKLKYPGLGESGVIGTIAEMQLAADRPDLYKNLQQQMQQSGALKQGETFNPMSVLQRNINAELSSKEALAQMRSGGGSAMRYAPTQQKNLIAFKDQLKKDHPDWDANTLDQATNGYLSGAEEVNGVKLPELGGQADTLRSSIYNKSSTAQIKNQAAALNNTASELNSIDITPIKEFSGVGGKANYMGMKLNPSSRTEAWRKYDAFRTVTATLIMDTLRNSFKTSVVPDYVNQTLGKFSNPNDEMWDDPKQVQEKWDTLLNWVNKSAKNVTRQAEHGATVKLNSGENSGDKKVKWKIENGQLVKDNT